MIIYLIDQRGSILTEISDPTVQGIFVTFNKGVSMDWDGLEYRIEVREQKENGDIYFHLSDQRNKGFDASTTIA